MAIKLLVLTESSSLLLDAIRLSAALMVVMAHLSHPEFAGSHARNLQFLGDFAVPVFFVLSGFVIRYVTVSRKSTLRLYIIDRASRIYSVALPAMALTIAVCGLCFVIDRPAYQREVAPLANHLLLRVTLNLTFLSQVWGWNTVQFGNLPFWSLSYECLFYTAYGFFFYLRGAWRIGALMIWAAVAGPPILLLFPLWIFGSALYDFYQFVRDKPIAVVLRWLTLLYAVLALALAAAGQTSLLLAPVQLDRAMASLPNPLILVHEVSIRATMLAIANGILAAAGMFLLLLLSDLVPLARNSSFARRFRRLADGTFAIYLMHYPLMMVARSLSLLRPDALLRNSLTTSAIVVVLIGVAAPLDSLKRALRRAMATVRLTRSASTAQPDLIPQSSEGSLCR